ncbi:MAG: Tll0287-like domain-containing protein [Flavitalea sp.]
MKQYFTVVLILSIIISCNNEEKNATGESTVAADIQEDLSNYKLKGDSIVAQTFDTLRNTLQAAVKEKGFDGAVEFCNTSASSLTNTYAANNITIERTSDKLRNPANAPDSMEQRILSQFITMAGTSEKPATVVEKDASGNIHYYKPILMQAMCLNCHGNKEQILPATLATIKSKYPDDLAVGYKEGDLRGIWHVVFKSE